MGFNSAFKGLKTIYVPLLVCYLNKLQSARCNDKDKKKTIKMMSVVFRNAIIEVLNPLNTELNPICQ